jgi:hypothetical protein
MVLALLEMVSHLLPAGRESAGAFKTFDTVLGAFTCSLVRGSSHVDCLYIF